MSKKLAIFLLSIHLVGNTELGQFLKLPLMVHHFFQHQHLNPQLGFFEFIAMHYAGDDGTKADDDFDKQLPCHNKDQSSISVAYSPMVRESQIIRKCFFKENEYNDRLQSGTSSKHVLLILQPPRTV